MTKPNDGGPAFPRIATVKEGFSQKTYNYRGMSLRQYYAATALKGMISSTSIVDRTKVNKKKWVGIAFLWADAMIKEEEK